MSQRDRTEIKELANAARRYEDNPPQSPATRVLGSSLLVTVAALLSVLVIVRV
jgi:hypothetical protein